MQRPEFENEYARFWIEAGVVFFVYKMNAVIDLAAAKQIVSDRIQFQKQADYPVYCDIRGLKSADKSARDYLAKEGSAYTKGVAVVVDSPMSKIIGNFYMGLNRPTTPTRLFTDESEAQKYLQQFVS
ncbi:MAG TPA: hypothetical protein VIN08_02975 [Ohtaekwangia sp.]|uniref:DUF7793 family protein n=1 Tax=Ohtaekwangia sp. TaxID=2066019 RepID=UPI002F92CB86